MATSSTTQHQYLIVETLSASNLPDVRTVLQTKPYLTVTGPVMKQHTTNVDQIGKCNPTWDTPFTISLQPTAPANTTLQVSVYIRRTRGDKLLGNADVPVADFEASDHEAQTREYTIHCTPDIRNASRAILRIAARLSSSPSTGGSSRNSPQQRPSSANTRPAAFSQGVRAGAGRAVGGAVATTIIGGITAGGGLGLQEQRQQPADEENQAMNVENDTDYDDTDNNLNDDYNEF